jgi:C-terminal processing protease CtpA/Prc
MFRVSRILGFGVLVLAGSLLVLPERSGLQGQEGPKDKVEKDKSDKPDKPAEPSLKDRLKKTEAEIVRLRAAMLKEVEDELKTVDDAIKTAEKALADAKNDFDARQKALTTLNKLRADRQQIQQMRFEVERMVTVHTPLPAFRIPPDQRLGFHTISVPPVLTAQLKLEKSKGLVVDRVDPKSPADAAGIQVNDVLLQVGGQPVPGDNLAFRKLLGDLAAEKPFDVVLLRQGKEETIKGLKIPPETPKQRP